MNEIEKLEKELEKLKQNKTAKKNKYSKIMVSAIIIANAIFTICIMYLFLKKGNEPMTLIGAWFSFTTVQLWNMASIKKHKIDKGV